MVWRSGSKYLILLIYLLSFKLMAAVINIPIHDKEHKLAPAQDLIFQDERIDEVKALELKMQGIDISKLNPYESNLWQNKAYPTLRSHLVQNAKGDLRFLDFRASPTEIFRAYVLDKNNKRYNVTASLDNHTNLVRAVILRKLGFYISPPKMLPATWFSFPNKERKEKFIEVLGEQTRTNRARWIEKEEERRVKIRHLIISPAELNNVNVYLPLMSRSRQEEKRIFRSLLAIYAVTDFPEAINKIAWNVGTIFNQNLSVTHPYASSFKNTTIDDLRWMMRRVCSLSSKDLSEAIDHAEYPEDFKELVFEKLKSRINTLANKIDISCSFPVDKELNTKFVKKGKLIKEDYDNTAIHYGTKDIISPYRFSELFRLFKTQAIFSSLSKLIESGLESVLPGIYNDDATKDIQQRVMDLQRENTPGVIPVKMFSSPTAYGRLFVNRNIIFGQYLGDHAPIQVVDSIGAELNLGVQNTITGLADNILPNIGISSTLNRTYSHIRAMPDLKTATKQKISRLLVPRLMKKLGRILKNEYLCSIPEDPFVEEKLIDDVKFFYVKYDPKVSGAQELAEKKRDELLASGVAQNRVILVKINRTDDCYEEIKEERDKTIQDFLKSFAENETFLITDTLRFGGLTNIPIPLLNSMNLSLSAERSHMRLRTVMLKKVKESIQVTLQEQRNNTTAFNESLSFYIRIAGNTDQFVKGKSDSKIFNIELEGIEEEQKETAIKVIRSLFVRNDKTLLFQNYKAQELDHKVKTYLNTFRFLWWKKERFKMRHDLDFMIPNQEGQEFSDKERTRSFYHVVDYKRFGSDFHSFINTVISAFTNLFSLGSPSNDPGKTFSGSSKKVYVSTEGELTPGWDLNPTTRVEFIRSGWNRRNKKLKKFLGEIDSYFKLSEGYKNIDNSFLHGSTKLESYDFRTTFILYPGALETLTDRISRNSNISRYLADLQGNKSAPRVRRLNRFIHSLSQSFMDKKEKLKITNKLYSLLFSKFDIAKVLKLIGENNFFATTRITGFRRNHHEGFLEHSSDTVGRYNSDIGTGVLDSIASKFNIAGFELRALNYTPGM